jgi:hypothetical protein
MQINFLTYCDQHFHHSFIPSQICTKSVWCRKWQSVRSFIHSSFIHRSAQRPCGANGDAAFIHSSFIHSQICTKNIWCPQWQSLQSFIHSSFIYSFTDLYKDRAVPTVTERAEKTVKIEKKMLEIEERGVKVVVVVVGVKVVALLLHCGIGAKCCAICIATFEQDAGQFALQHWSNIMGNLHCGLNERCWVIHIAASEQDAGWFALRHQSKIDGNLHCGIRARCWARCWAICIAASEQDVGQFALQHQSKMMGNLHWGIAARCWQLALQHQS